MGRKALLIREGQNLGYGVNRALTKNMISIKVCVDLSNFLHDHSDKGILL